MRSGAQARRSGEVGGAAAGSSREDLSEYMGTARLYMTLAKLVEYNNWT